jgi:uncharacterized protein (TIGR03067 family)
MRLLTIISLVLVGFGCANTKAVTSAASGQLNGIWLPVKQEIGGTVLPKAVFETQKLIISDSNYTVVAESVDKGIVHYDGNKMDIYGKDGVNKGKHFTAIYKLENGELTVCYNLLGTIYPTAFGTQGKPMYFMSVFKKG